MREITSHKVNGLNEAIKIEATGPGPGGAPLLYRIAYAEGQHDIIFQNGNPAEGVNGISNEALLAIVEDRLEGFQNGPFKCRENALALTKVQEAMHWLHHRTRQRVQRGIEGTLQK